MVVSSLVHRGAGGDASMRGSSWHLLQCTEVPSWASPARSLSRWRTRRPSGAVDKLWEGGHVVEYGGGGGQFGGVGHRGEAEDLHAGRVGGGDAEWAVLDDHAVGRFDAHRGGGVQEQVGRGLAVRHVLRAED